MKRLLTAAGALFCFTVGVATATLLPIHTQLAPAPVEWVHDTYQQGIQVCPGDTVFYTLGIKYDRDSVIRFAQSIDRADNHMVTIEHRNSELGHALSVRYNAKIVGDTVSAGPAPDSIVLKGTDGTNIRIDPDAKFVVPDLGPGPYVRNVAVWVEGRDARVAIRQQRFTIKDSCNVD